MRFLKTIRAGLAALMVLALVACGGGGGGDAGTTGLGGGAGTPVLGGGTQTGGPSLVLGISSATITAQSPATVSASLRDGSGSPISGAVISFSTARTDLGRLSADSALTNTVGMGAVGLSAASSGLTGADVVTVTATLGTTTLTSKIGFSVTGATATLQATIDNTTLRTSLGPVRFSAVVKDAAGQPLPGQIVAFASSTGVVKIAAATSLTDSSGFAVTTVTPADGSIGAADSLIASTTVNGKSVQSSINVQVLSESPSISLVLVGNQSISAATPGTLQATVRDSNGLTVAGAVVSFSSQFGLGAFSAGTASTAPVSGTATVAVAPKTATSTGADVITASVTVSGVTRTAQRVIDIVGAASTVSAQLQLNISSSTVTPLAPATLTMSLLDSLGKPVPGVVITLSTSRGNLGVLSAATVLTGPDGTALAGKASAQLQSAAAGIAGADEVLASATVLGQTLQARVGFTVDNATPTLQMQYKSGVVPPILYSAGSIAVQAKVLGASGQSLSGQVVNFSSDNKLTNLSGASAISDAQGFATVLLRAKDASTTGVEIITATASVAGRALQASLNVALKAETPTVVVDVIPAAGSSVITASAPATVRATVTNTNGVLVPNALVSFSVQGVLGVFDASTASTGSTGIGNGQATVKLAPANSSTSGADVVTASVTVDGVRVTQQKVVQFSATSTAVKSPLLSLSLDSLAIDSAHPTVVRAVLTDASGAKLQGQVVAFSVVRGLAITNVGTALTDSNGLAQARLSPSSSSVAGADEVKAAATVGGVDLSALQGFEVKASNVTLDSFVSAATSLSAYGQTTFTLAISGASVGSPVNVELSSLCVKQGKATLSPLKIGATSSPVTFQYRDNGCGAIQSSDQVQAIIVGTDVTKTLSVDLSRPDVSSVAFVQAVPEQIFLKGSGFVETSVVRFEVRDGGGNPLPRQSVDLVLLTGAGGVTVQNNAGQAVGVGVIISRDTDDSGRVEIRVNAGTIPTPVRIQASLTSTIKTVSSNLSVGVGLPSQLNFSMSQLTRNIEGFNVDGTANTYNIIASDRSGNPVPLGTSINFVTEGGQIEPIKQIQLVNGLARTSAQFISSSPRPADGRITVTAYALGEESFIDQNGNNSYDSNEPFQDLGNVFKDRIFDGSFDPSVDEYVPTNIANTDTCRTPALSAPVFDVSTGMGSTPVTSALLALDASIPSVGGSTCDAKWSGAGKVYVRRATETVLSTSGARTLWASTSGLDSSCRSLVLQNGPLPANISSYTPVQGGDIWYTSGTAATLSFIVADANSIRLNPMAAGTTVTVSTPTNGVKVVLAGGSTVPSTTEATFAAVGVTFDNTVMPVGSPGTVFVTFTSPSGVGTTYAIDVKQATRPSSCP